MTWNGRAGPYPKCFGRIQFMNMKVGKMEQSAVVMEWPTK